MKKSNIDLIIHNFRFTRSRNNDCVWIVMFYDNKEPHLSNKLNLKAKEIGIILIQKTFNLNDSENNIEYNKNIKSNMIIELLSYISNYDRVWFIDDHISLNNFDFSLFYNLIHTE